MADTHPVVSLFFKQAREKLFSFSKTDAIMLYKGNKFQIHQFKAQGTSHREDLLFAQDPKLYLALSCCSFLRIPLEYKQMQAGQAVPLKPGLLDPECKVPMYTGLPQLKAQVEFTPTLAILVNWSKEEIRTTLDLFADQLLAMHDKGVRSQTLQQSCKKGHSSKLVQLMLSVSHFQDKEREVLYEGDDLEMMAQRLHKAHFSQVCLFELEFLFSINSTKHETYMQILVLPGLDSAETENMLETLSHNRQSLLELEKLHSANLMVQLFIRPENESECVDVKYFLPCLKGIAENVKWVRNKVNVVSQSSK